MAYNLPKNGKETNLAWSKNNEAVTFFANKQKREKGNALSSKLEPKGTLVDVVK